MTVRRLLVDFERRTYIIGSGAHNSPRQCRPKLKYTVREVKENGSVNTVGEFGGHASERAAWNYLHALMEVDV